MLTTLKRAAQALKDMAFAREPSPAYLVGFLVFAVVVFTAGYYLGEA